MDILGQPQVLHYLAEGLKREIISPSLLFAGPEGVGKKLCALEVAKCFACEKPDGGPGALPRCGRCRACVQVAGNNHADVLLLDRTLQATLLKEKPESQNAIKIDSIRYLDKFLSLKPLDSRRRVALIDDAHKLTTDAANSLLKLLEEPPNKAQIILIATDEHSLPPTVVSRCAVLRFRPIPVKIIADWLDREHAVSESKAMDVADRAGGSFQKALSLKDEDRATTELSDYTLDEFFAMLAGTNWRKEGRKQAESAVTNLIESSQRKLEGGDLNQAGRLTALLAARKQIDRNVPVKLVLEALYVKLEGTK